MAEGRFLKTLYIHKPGALQNRVGGETLVVCGTARGMTSAAAYALHECGYFLGEKLGVKNYEDRDLINIFRKKRTVKQKPIKTLIDQRNFSHDRWGFKIPFATEFVSDLLPMLRKPIFLFCVRNPLAASASAARREKLPVDPLKTLNKSRMLLDAMDWMREQDQPFIAADMDAVRLDPARFVAELSKTLNLKGDVNGIASALSKPGYKPADPQPGVTYCTQ
ncbi:MAG: hypothetical protein AAGF71_07280 [Pseudomonadota bacterium]